MAKPLVLTKENVLPTMEGDMDSELSYEERAENILPNWSYWGGGVVLIKKENWYKSQKKIIAILKQLRKAKNERSK